MSNRADIMAGTLRSKNGIAAGDLATYRLVNGASVKLHVLRVERDGDAMRLVARVTSPTAHGYRRGEIITTRDSAFIDRRPRVGEPPNAIIRDAMGSSGRSFVWHDTYGAGWTRWSRPPGNARFWIVQGAK